MLRLAFAFLFGSIIFAQQLDTNSVTVTASRNLSPQADQVVFGITVESDSSATLNDILSALAGSGIALANFSSVRTNYQTNLKLEWNFVQAVPLTKIKETVAAITALQQSIGKARNGMSLSFQVQGTQVSQQLQQSQPCVMADLISDARAQAQKLADVSGRLLGSILAVSGSVSTTTSSPATAYSYSGPPSCSATVKFALTGI